MDAIGRRLVIGLSVVIFLFLYVASWYWLYPEAFSIEMFIDGWVDRSEGRSISDSIKLAKYECGVSASL